MRRVLAFALVAAALIAIWALAGGPQGTAALLRDWHAALAALAGDWPIAAAAAFVLSTAVAKTTPVTGGGLIVIIGGALFGALWGGLLAALGAAASALLVAGLGRRFATDLVMDRWGERFAEIEHRLLEDGFSYFLALRLLPVAPAWFTNLVPVVVPIPLWQVGLATFLGVLPISLIGARLGSGVAYLAAADALSLAAFAEPQTLVPLALLSLLALLPPLLRRRARRGA